ncbi:MAG TPA: DUF1508 domain-containing protein [Chryseolinea sp.]|nr:DUF1508 domain-containing protein [Chryseolinea sp.]
MRTPKFEIYKDKSKQFRWRLKASNGRIIAESGEAYKRKRELKASISNIEFWIKNYNCPIIDKTKP